MVNDSPTFVDRDGMIYQMVTELRKVKPDDKSLESIFQQFRRTAIVEILKSFQPSQAIIDRICLEALRDYEAEAEKSDFRFLADKLIEVISIASLGVSKNILQQILPHVIRQGWLKTAEDIAKQLGRRLSKKEVWELVSIYTQDYASSSACKEEAIVALAKKIFSGAEFGRLQQVISEKNWRLSFDCY